MYAIRSYYAEKIADIPLAPDEIAGAINLRGRIVTVVDVRKRLGLPDEQNSKNMCTTVEIVITSYSIHYTKLYDTILL